MLARLKRARSERVQRIVNSLGRKPAAPNTPVVLLITKSTSSPAISAQPVGVKL
jgi:hypothetical protein